MNPAVRVAFEYTYIRTAFNQYGLNNGGNAAPANGQFTGYTGGALSTVGSVQQARVALFYFF